MFGQNPSASPSQPRWGAGAAQQSPTQAQQPTAAQPAAAGPAWGARAPVQQQAHPAAGGFQARGAPRSPFSGIENAQVSTRGTYLNAGRYLLKVGNVIYNSGFRGDMAIIEVEIVFSDHDPHTNPKTNRIGTSASIYMKKNEAFLNNLKAFIIAASGFDAQGNPRPLDDVVTEEEANGIFSEQQPLQGVVIAVEAVDRQGRQDPNKVYTNFNYFPVKLDAQGNPDQNFDPFQRMA